MRGSRSGAFNYSRRTIPPLVSFGDYIYEYLFASPFHARHFHRFAVSIRPTPFAALALDRSLLKSRRSFRKSRGKSATWSVELVELATVKFPELLVGMWLYHCEQVRRLSGKTHLITAQTTKSYLRKKEWEQLSRSSSYSNDRFIIFVIKYCYKMRTRKNKLRSKCRERIYEISIFRWINSVKIGDLSLLILSSTYLANSLIVLIILLINNARRLMQFPCRNNETVTDDLCDSITIRREL